MNTQSIKGENILLLGPKFYGYCKFICKELENLGANVIFEQVELWGGGRYSHDSCLRKILHRLRHPNWESRETLKILSKIGDTKIDRLIVIAVYSSSLSLIDELKKRNSTLKTYIYFWDAFSTWNFSYLLKHFDYCYSFDRQDCERFDTLTYLPLFWRKEQLKTENTICKYDITHIGTLRIEYSKRLDICPIVYNDGINDNLNNFIYLVWKNNENQSIKARLKNLLKFLFRDSLYLFSRKVELARKHTPIIHEEPLPIDKVSYVETSSRAILDINMDRAGLSMRLIGAIANGKKIITNNKYIADEKFYSPQNILILDENNPKIDKDWLYSPNTTIDIDYLRIDNWIKTILNISK